MTRSERIVGRATTRRTLARLACAVLATAVVGACAADGSDDLIPASSGPITMDGRHGANSFRSLTVQIPVDDHAGEAGQAEQSIAAIRDGSPSVIYLNRNGGTFRGGNDDSSNNVSSVVYSTGLSEATIPPYRGGDANWGAIVSCLQDMFSRFNVTVTDTEPAAGTDYVEAVFGGTAGAISLPPNVGGVAPIDLRRCSSIWRAVVYAFTDALGTNPQLACEVAAQEIAHAYSLEHELLASDPMTYLPYSGHRTFQDESARCGEYASAPRDCSCGRGTQNSVQLLTQVLGARDGSPMSPPMMPPPMMMPPPSSGDRTPPVVGIVSPAEGAMVPGNAPLTVSATASDDTALASVELLWLYNGTTMACPGSGPGWTCSASGGAFNWTLNVGTGDRTFQVRARDTNGNVTTSPNRAIRLVTSGSTPTPPPADTSTSIRMVTPTSGGAVHPGDVVDVAADVSDADGIAEVVVIWHSPAGDAARPLDTMTGDRWTTSLQVSPAAAPGTRTVTIQAVDRLGNVTTGTPVTLTIAP